MIEIIVISLLVAFFVVAGAVVQIGFVGLYLLVWQRLLSRMTSPVAGNRFLYWPVAFAIGWPLLFASLWLLYAVTWVPIISELLFVILGGALVTIWVGTVLVTFKLMKQWVAARFWRTMLSALILPLSFFVTVSISPVILKDNYARKDDVKFFAHYRSYLADVEKRPATEPRFVVWLWEGDDDFGLLYDESDQIASDHPSESWIQKASREGVDRSYHRHIIGHFYFVRLDLEGDVRHDVMQGYDLYKSGRISPRK